MPEGLVTNKVEQIKDELQGLSLDVVEWLRDVVPHGKDFVVEQMPQVIQEIVTRSIMLSSIGVCFGVMFFTAALLAFRTMLKERKARFDIKSTEYGAHDLLPFEMVMVAISIVGTMAGIITTSINAHKLIYVLSAPKLFILEYLKELI